MSSHPTDFQGSVIDALREAIEQQIPNSRAAVNGGGGGHFSIEVTSPAFAGRSMIESQWLVYGAIAHLMKGDASLVIENVTRQRKFPVHHLMSPRQVQHLLSGGLINWMKERLAAQ